jgi:hypothetical protein
MAAEIQGHRDPFHPRLLGLTLPQLDFVLEKAALSEPDKYRFSRGKPPEPVSNATAAWWSVFEGGALQRLMSRTLNMSVIRKRKAEATPPPGLGLRGKGLKDGVADTADGPDTGRGQ